MLFTEKAWCDKGLLLEGGVKGGDGIKSTVISNVGDIQLGLIDKQRLSFFYPEVVDVAVEIAIEMAVDELR